MDLDGRRIPTIDPFTIDQNILNRHGLRARDLPARLALTTTPYDPSPVGHRRPAHPAGAYSGS